MYVRTTSTLYTNSVYELGDGKARSGDETIVVEEIVKRTVEIFKELLERFVTKFDLWAVRSEKDFL